ncbi:hypothetical protein DFH07DRAFT_1068637 [Mycena maculata]|uniref:THO1-MOS11 C-terminal domain-containing protein n=1 Tax=Mycena maculata TaxID=230809 RepID=A0AAD7H6Y1_9AGAR|nr:hypothetical protein DFH07DRAFT_1068637 [Mycena maculata]
MEAKLKTLKVVDLKDILAKAQQQPPQKATKPDLIARILASKEATLVYNAKYAPKDDLLAPPEDLDWDVDQVNAPETPVEQPKSTSVPTPAKSDPPVAATDSTPTAVTPAAAPAPAPVSDDVEAEKRRKRAERFGIPVVEPKPTIAKKATAATTKQPDAPEKLDARAARFGTKRAAPVEEVDAEEQERRKKRAERFGTGPAKG